MRIDKKDHYHHKQRGCWSDPAPGYIIGGTVASGYEEVAQIFEQHFRDGAEDRAQVCAYVGGFKVLELWGATEEGYATPSHGAKRAKTISYGSAWLQNIFSSGKSLESLVIAMLVDRGCLSYDEKISAVWPEFAFGGDETHPNYTAKAGITIAMLMRHEAGLPRLTASNSWKLIQALKLSDLTTESILNGAVSEAFEQQQLIYTPGSRREYHAWSRGWIVNEICRRADPQHRTVGQFLQQEVAQPLGICDELRIGTPERLFDKVAPLTHAPLWWTWKNVLLPRVLGGGKIPCCANGEFGLLLRPMALGVIPVLGVCKMAMEAVGLTGSRMPIPELETEIDDSTDGDPDKSHDLEVGVYTAGMSKFAHDPSNSGSSSDEEQDSSPLLMTHQSTRSTERLKFGWPQNQRPAQAMTAGQQGAAALQRLNGAAWRRAEMPSVNAHASARALAKVAAAIVESLPSSRACHGAVFGRDTTSTSTSKTNTTSTSSASVCGGGTGSTAGEMEGCAPRPGGTHTSIDAISRVHPLLSANSAALAHSGVKKMKIAFGPLLPGLVDSHFGNAGWNDFKGSRMGFVGWMGAGGSVLQWHPGQRIGFGYAMNLLEVTPTCERARAMQVALLKCAEEQPAALHDGYVPSMHTYRANGAEPCKRYC